jgi:ketosteroid isomerase-like protein
MITKDIAENIISIERAALERWGRGDPEGFLEASAEEVVYFDPYVEKRVVGKPALRERYQTIWGKIRVDRFEMIDPSVQVCGNTAVLTFNHISHVDDRRIQWNCTEVYQQQDGDWKIIHSHWSYTCHPAIVASPAE